MNCERDRCVRERLWRTKWRRGRPGFRAKTAAARVHKGDLGNAWTDLHMVDAVHGITLRLDSDTFGWQPAQAEVPAHNAT
jgi:hypothetical protein